MTVQDKVVNIGDYKPHLSGAAVCFGCHNKWESCSPIGVSELECPKCHTMRGRYFEPILRKGDHWVCKCGCIEFRITKDCIYCPSCGLEHTPFD